MHLVLSCDLLEDGRIYDVTNKLFLAVSNYDKTSGSSFYYVSDE